MYLGPVLGSVSTNQVSLPAETQRVTRERPRDIRDQSTQLPRKIRVGDWVIITSGTGGLRGTRAQVVEIKTRSYVQQKAQEDREIARQNEEFVLSILLMVVSAGLIVSMIWFVG